LDGLHGRLRTITSPDPDGAGSLLPIVTTYQYSSLNYNLPSRIYHADGSYREWTYDQWDRVTLERDELNRITVYVWDEMDRLRAVTKPTGAMWSFNYGRNGQLSEEIDPLGMITRYSYDARYRLVSQTLPDPDSAFEALVAPVFTWTYNQTGEVIESTNPTYAAGIKDVYQYDSAGRMTKHIGPLTAQYSNTQETIYEYDLRDRLVRTKFASGLIEGKTYDARDRMIRHYLNTSATGSFTGPYQQSGYDAAGRMTSSGDELFRTTDYLYSNNGWLIRTTLPDPDLTGPQTRVQWNYTYDTLGRQTTVQNPLGRITTTAYDNRHRVSSVTTPDPDGVGSLQAQVYSYQYDLIGNLKQINLPLNRIVQYDYDDLDRMIRVKLPHPDLANQTGPEWNYQYGLTGSPNVTQQTDPLGRVTVFAYDNLYRQKQITLPDPDGSGTFYTSPIWQWKYNDQTLLQSVVDPLNRSTIYGYDNAGRTTSMQQPGITGQYSYAYDKLDRLTMVTEPAPGTAGVTASVTEYTYDLRSRLQQVKDARLGTTNYAWNDANELLSLTDSVGNTTQWSYDRMGRKVLETNSRGFTRFSEYDRNSNLTRSIDRTGRIVQYTLDALDRLTKEEWNPGAPGTTAAPEVTVQTITQGATGVNEVQRINVANLSATAPGTFVIGFNGRTTAHLNWDATATQVRDALVATFGGVAADYTVTYALVSGVRQYTVTFTGANAAKNQAQMQGSAKLNAIPAAVRTLEWTFDDGGRLASTTDRDAALVSQSSYQFVYDQLNRMTMETGTIARLTPQVRMTRTYDAVGNRRSLLADFVVGANVTKDFKNEFWFDALNRVSVQTQTVQGTGAGHHLVQDKRATNTYNELGQVTFLIRYQNFSGTGDSLRTVSQYDAANRLQTLSHRNVGSSTTILSNYAYGYDNMSRITSINHTASVAANADGISNFSYDKTSQLTGADHAPTRPDENYSYDLNGNRTGGSYQTGTNNLTTEDAEFTYLFDKVGNRTRRTEKATGHYEQYTFDHRNRLVQVLKSDATPEVDYVSYSYDTFNRLVFRQQITWSPSLNQNTSVKDTFFGGYEGINPTLQFETAGTTWTPNATANDLKHRLWWGQGVDQLLADEQYSGTAGGTTPGSHPTSSVGVTLWALADHLGTIRDIAQFNGTSFSIVNHRRFDSFGNLEDINGQTNEAFNIDYRYTGKWFDDFTALSHHWNRWYDPKLGKWISEDPIGFRGGDANLGRYVGNGVYNFIDTNGLVQEPVQENDDRPLSSGTLIVTEEQRIRADQEQEDIETDDIPFDINDIQLSYPTPGTFMSGIATGISDLYYGGRRVSKTLYYGVGSIFSIESDYSLSLLGQEMEDAIVFSDWLREDTRSKILDVVNRALTIAWENVPKEKRDEFIRRAAANLGVYSTGRLSGNVAMNYVSRLVVEKVAERFVASMASSNYGRPTKTGATVAVSITMLSYQIYGVWEKLTLAEKRFKEKHPAEYHQMHGYHRSSILYGFMEETLDEIFTLSKELKAEHAREAK
jgi:RHS repeat-associated protein